MSEPPIERLLPLSSPQDVTKSMLWLMQHGKTMQAATRGSLCRRYSPDACARDPQFLLTYAAVLGAMEMPEEAKELEEQARQADTFDMRFYEPLGFYFQLTDVF